MTGNGHDRSNPNAGLAQELGDFIRRSQTVASRYRDHFSLVDDLSISVANLLLDLAECEARGDFLNLDIRGRIAEIGTIAARQYVQWGGPMEQQRPALPPDTPYSGSYPGAPQVSRTPMREVLARADQGADANYVNDDTYGHPDYPAHYQPAPQPYHPAEFAQFAPPPNGQHPQRMQGQRQPINGR